VTAEVEAPSEAAEKTRHRRVRLGVAGLDRIGQMHSANPAGRAPTPARAPMVEQAAAADRHVVCEKPIALEVEPAIVAIEAARAVSVKSIAAGELGDVYAFRTSRRDKPSPRPGYLTGSGGFFIDVTIHDQREAGKALGEIGISIRDPDEPVARLSGGERQSIAIARGVHFSAKLLILDEPTSALSLKQAAQVLESIEEAGDKVFP
jgi:ABC-type dipeptide/oligopeptide/nickel transport system ATPase component